VQRRSITGGDPVKTRRGKAATPKRGNAPKAVRGRSSPIADLQEQLDRRTRELHEALEQQTATAEVLGVISRSAFDLQAVFETVVERSARLSGADRARANIFRFDGELLRLAATFNVPGEARGWLEQHPFRPGRQGGTARAALERRTIHIPDILADPEYSFGAGAKGVEPFRTILAVPILKGDDLLGVMITYHLEVRPFTDKQIALVETFADQAAIAIENVRLLDALRERTDELSRSVEELRALGEVSQAVNSTLDLETVLSTIVAKAVQLSGTEAGAIYVFDELEREFRLRATYGMDQELIDALRQQHIGMDEPNVERAFAEGEPIQVADLREDAPSPANEIVLRAGYRARLAAPLMRGEEMVGMLVVRRRTPGAFPQNTVDLMKTFAAQSALAIELNPSTAGRVPVPCHPNIVCPMYHHVKKLMYTVRVDEPDPRFGNMLLEQFGGANGELAAAMQYSVQGPNSTIRVAKTC
jgi:two-component system, NtrC family, sensor kinase